MSMIIIDAFFLSAAYHTMQYRVRIRLRTVNVWPDIAKMNSIYIEHLAMETATVTDQCVKLMGITPLRLHSAAYNF
eukprot:2114284-Pleurochrysis_carterae.AAC.5